ncbi:unnamed protein product [Orchesella dallaii]|uniref:Galactosylgalactosylxylosylprotein 3-beta-glucuronosyltransferase n=1 Tax=Orchesella dallaii TaxID=48710 RepID=A0ABP1RZZ6_9HEXA
MRIIHPLNVVEEYYYADDNFLPGGDDPNEPLNRIYITLKILLVNLSFGCLITFIFFKCRNCISSCVSWICCGNCDCDNDSYGRMPPPRSRHQSKNMRTANNSKSGSSEEGEDCCTVELSWTCSYISLFWSILKRLFLRKFVMSMAAGLVLAYLIMQTQPEDKNSKPLIHSFSDPRLLSEKKVVSNGRRVFFITPSARSGFQIPRLTRLAQSLYPNKDFVTWVVVSHDPQLFQPWSRLKLEHWTRAQALSWSSNETKVMGHLKDLSDMLDRFGIPFVLLSAHDVHVLDDELYSKSEQVARQSIKFNKAGHIGISWVVNTYSDGVILVGIEDASYNFHLLQEIRDTKIMSSWPTASFDSRYFVGLTTPILYRNKPLPKGFYGGGTVRLGHIPLQYGTYAVSVKFAKEIQMQSEIEFWKLTSHEELTTADLNITARDVEPMGKNCTEIYVWRLMTYFPYTPIVVALFAMVAVASGQLLGVPATGYGFIGGLTKLPNLGFGNIAGVNSNQNTLGYNFVTRENGPISGRVHAQAAHAPLGLGIPVGYGLGYGYGLGGGIIG